MAMELVTQLPYDHPYRWDGTAFGGPKLWRPNSLESGLALWLDAEDASTIMLNGSTVSQWADKSGNNRHFSQGAAAYQPTYTANALNGKNSLTFSTENTIYLESNAAGIGALGNGPRTIACVCKPVSVRTTATEFFGAVFSWPGFNSGLLVSPEGASSSPIYARSTQWQSDTGGNQSEAVAAFVNSTPTLMVAKVYVNTGESTFQTSSSTNGGTENFGGLRSGIPSGYTLARIGISKNTGDFQWRFGGVISELVVMGSAANSAVTQRIEGYLAWKWGTQSSLPENHPYKLLPPTV